MNRGIVLAIGAYVAWGVFPIYWKLLNRVPSVQLLSHRIIWSFIFLMLYILVSKQFSTFLRKINYPRVFLFFFLSAVLIWINWLTYIWAVNAGNVVETSLGYFINPLLNVVLGVFILREKLRRFQWIPVILAGIGVFYLTSIYGRIPWIALTLAFSFGLYGLVKKLAPLGSLFGLTLETAILFLPAVVYIVTMEKNHLGAFQHISFNIDLLLLGSGLITAIPLLLFASAAQRIPLSLLGIIQYIAPTMQFLLGIVVFKEHFTKEHLIGFCIVWVAIIIFLGEGVFLNRKRRKSNKYSIQ